MQITKYVTHSFQVQKLAMQEGWEPGARYTNLRDIRRFERLGFLDIDWQDYSFKLHLKAVKATQPHTTVARDIVDLSSLDKILHEAEELSNYCERVVVVPKDIKLSNVMESAIPPKFAFGYSVPTKYGGTQIPTSQFRRKVHLLGGRPDVQRRLGEELDVASLDCNRFTLDATFGDFFDGETFRPHPVGGYERYLVDSIRNINNLWDRYLLNGDHLVRE